MKIGEESITHEQFIRETRKLFQRTFFHFMEQKDFAFGLDIFLFFEEMRNPKKIEECCATCKHWNPQIPPGDFDFYLCELFSGEEPPWESDLWIYDEWGEEIKWQDADHNIYTSPTFCCKAYVAKEIRREENANQR